VRATRPVLAQLDIKVDERTATALPLALAAIDTAEAIYTLLRQQPEHYWVAALVMQRSQMEYVLRAAFFAKAASHREVVAFRRTGAMPRRGNRPIHLAAVAEEACHHLGWENPSCLAPYVFTNAICPGSSMAARRSWRSTLNTTHGVISPWSGATSLITWTISPYSCSWPSGWPCCFRHWVRKH